MAVHLVVKKTRASVKAMTEFERLLHRAALLMSHCVFDALFDRTDAVCLPAAAAGAEALRAEGYNARAEHATQVALHQGLANDYVIVTGAATVEQRLEAITLLKQHHKIDVRPPPSSQDVVRVGPDGVATHAVIRIRRKREVWTIDLRACQGPSWAGARCGPVVGRGLYPLAHREDLVIAYLPHVGGLSDALLCPVEDEAHRCWVTGLRGAIQCAKEIQDKEVWKVAWQTISKTECHPESFWGRNRAELESCRSSGSQSVTTLKEP